jgi:hypothetical protein
MVCTETWRSQQTRAQKRHAAGQSVDPQLHAPVHRCQAARLLQPPQAIKPRLHTLLQANRLAKVSNERARLVIEAIVAKVVKDLCS